MRASPPKKQSRVFDACLALLFTGALFIPMLGLRQTPPTALSEKRLPATRPGLPRSWQQLEEFPRAFEAWFNDHFGLRDAMIRAHSRILYFVLHTSPSPKAVLGRDGFIFLRGRPDDDGNPIADYRGTSPLSRYELERWRWQIEDESEWLAAQGVSFLFAVAPGKERMAADCLPPGFGNIGRPGALDQFTAHLQPRATFRFLDLRAAISTAHEAARGFRRTDTHWNDDGAWAAIRAMTAALRLEFPTMPTPDELDLTRTRAWYSEGDMGNVVGLPGEVGEWLDWIRPREPRAKATYLKPHHLADITTDTGNDALPDAVLFHDSFGHYLKPFFGEHFNKLRFCWSNAGLEPRVVAAHKPQIVIHLMGERRIRMGQRYPVSLQQYGNKARFNRSKIILAQWTPDAAPIPFVPLAGAETSLEGKGLTLTPKPGKEVAWEWPAIPETAESLPVIRLRLNSSRVNELAMSWRTTSAEYTPDFAALRIKAPLPKGDSEVYLPLLDPEAAGPLMFHLKRANIPLLVKQVEIRAVPRN